MWQRKKVGNQIRGEVGTGSHTSFTNVPRMPTSGPTNEPEGVTEELRLFWDRVKGVCGILGWELSSWRLRGGHLDRNLCATDLVARGQTFVQARSFW